MLTGIYTVTSASFEWGTAMLQHYPHSTRIARSRGMIVWHLIAPKIALATPPNVLYCVSTACTRGLADQRDGKSMLLSRIDVSS